MSGSVKRRGETAGGSGLGEGARLTSKAGSEKMSPNPEGISATANASPLNNRALGRETSRGASPALLLSLWPSSWECSEARGARGSAEGESAASAGDGEDAA